MECSGSHDALLGQLVPKQQEARSAHKHATHLGSTIVSLVSHKLMRIDGTPPYLR